VQVVENEGVTLVHEAPGPSVHTYARTRAAGSRSSATAQSAPAGAASPAAAPAALVSAVPAPVATTPTAAAPVARAATVLPSTSEPPVVPGRRPRPARRWWVSVLVAVLGLLAGWATFVPHRSAWIGHNGDHYYYASAALMYAGAGYEESLRVATEYFNYPYSATQLDLGYLDPAVAPLIYPRVVLGLLAVPAVQLFGISGIWFPGVLCGVLSLALLMVLTVRRVGRIGLLSVPVLIGVTKYAPEFMFGIYAEAPVILATTLMLLAFPLGRARRTWAHVLAAVALVPIIMLSRQVPLLPTGMVLGGYVWAVAGSRKFRNPWLPYALTVLPMTVLSYWAVSVWAPYNALMFLYTKTGTSALDQLIEALPSMWSQSIGVDWAAIQANDYPMLVVTGLGLVGFLLVLRNPLSGVFLGTLASGAATELLNGQPNDFRYLAPSLPVVILMAAFVVAWVVHQLPRLLGQTLREWPGAHLARGQVRQSPGTVHVLPDGRMRITRPEGEGRAPTRWGPLLAAASAWAMAGAFLYGAAAVHPAAVMDNAPHEQVSAFSVKGPWPLGVAEGTLSCAGDDYQIWFTAPDGVRYALSGTAMAAAPRAPRILDLAPTRFEYSWPEIKPLITEGMRLCGSNRAFQADPR
jgi:hypothetical protein